jgi:hypothetical protein
VAVVDGLVVLALELTDISFFPVDDDDGDDGTAAAATTGGVKATASLPPTTFSCCEGVEDEDE